MLQRIRDEVLDILKIKPSTAETMAHLIGTSKEEIYWAIHNLRREGHKIVNINGKYKIATTTSEVKAEINKLCRTGKGYFITSMAIRKGTQHKQLKLF